MKQQEMVARCAGGQLISRIGRQHSACSASCAMAFEVRASAVRIAGGCHECGKPELAALLLMAGTRVEMYLYQAVGWSPMGRSGTAEQPSSNQSLAAPLQPDTETLCCCPD
ncbi:TPA: hypothetical protein ACH3X3_010528 [Trebouxia sp. C0006]